MRRGRTWGAGGAVCVLACGLVACGGTGGISSVASWTGTGARTGLPATTGADATDTAVGSPTAPTVVTAFGTLNGDAAVRAAVRVTAPGRNGCAVRQRAGRIELDLWDPTSHATAEAITVRRESGTTRITRVIHPPTWRPPGGSNCTVTASDTVNPF